LPSASSASHHSGVSVSLYQVSKVRQVLGVMWLLYFLYCKLKREETRIKGLVFGDVETNTCRPRRNAAAPVRGSMLVGNKWCTVVSNKALMLAEYKC
jgi:hypothetical protein